MRRFFFNRLRRRYADESGIALVMGLGLSIAIAIAGTSALDYASSNQRSAVRSNASQVAYVLAEAGLNDAASVLSNPANNPLDGTLLPSRTTTYTEGSVTWSGSLDAATATWSVRATGSVRNPFGSAPSARTVTAHVPVTPVYVEPVPNRAWDYIYTTRIGGTCDVMLSSKVVMSSPLWVTGNLCLSAGASVSGGPLVVKGKLTMSSLDSTVGSPNPVSAAHLAGACKYYTYDWHQPCTAADNIFGPIDQTIPAITPPTPAWDAWYAAAMPGPRQACTSSSGTPPVFENETVNATRNNSVPTVFSLTPLANYTCRVGPADKPIGELSWDATSHTLTVNGTIFIDGSVKVDNGLLNLYKGHGTLYLSGTMLLTASSKLCAKLAATDCDFAGWNPTSSSDSMLTVVANGNGGQVTIGDGVQLAASASVEAGIEATNAVALGNYAQTKGPMICSTIILGSSTQTYTFPSMTVAPTGTPGAQFTYAHVESPKDFSG